MTGFVFIVTFPSEEHEKYLKSKTKKKVVIVEARNTMHASPPSACTPVNKSNDDFFNNKYTPNLSPIGTDYEYISMEKLVKDVLSIHKLDCHACYHHIDDNYLQVIFSIEEGDKCEEILDVLRENNLGQSYESTISIIPCSLYYHGANSEEAEPDLNNIEISSVKDTDTAWARFVSSVRARLTVAQVVEVLNTDATLTFDFICLLMIAALLCAIGLVEDSNIYLLSSMLISPMMGPVMAGTFGTVIGDRALQQTGVRSELIGLGVAMLTGFCYGAIICFCTDNYGQVGWPTSEMVSRGEARNLGVGCLVALLSGAAVAVGILSDNIASLVGVAISTSLMPPAVNAGLFWSLASVYYVKGNETTRYAKLTYSERYSTDKFIELTSLGGISLCLTFINIVCIYVAGILIFKIKEVAPIRMKSETRRHFWKHAVRITRDYNRTLQKEDACEMRAQLANELKLQGCAAAAGDATLLNASKDSSSSSSTRGQDPHKSLLLQSDSSCTVVSKRPTIQELQELYRNITRRSDPNTPTHASTSTRSRRLSQVIASPQLIGDIVDASPAVYVDTEQTGSGHQKRRFIVTPVINNTNE